MVINDKWNQSQPQAPNCLTRHIPYCQNQNPYYQNPDFFITARTQISFLLPEPKFLSYCQKPKPYSNPRYNNARSASDVKHFIEDAV